MGSHSLISFYLLLWVLYINAAVVSEEENIRRRCRVDLPSCFPTQLEWAELQDNLTGILVFPEQSDNYTAANFQYNQRVKTYPLVHVMVRSAEDIRTAILFARRHNLHVTIKSSGSDFLGRSSAHSSFCINLMLMKDIQVNNSTTPRSEHGEITVQTGASWKEIFMEVDKYKRVIVGPGAQVVSSGGYTMGGGHSPLSPALGLAVDNVLEIQVVLADGRISTCTENKTVHLHPDGREETENHGDLFWALRGGGGGTFGVVVHYVFKMYAAPESLVRVIIVMPFYHNSTATNIANEVFEKFYSWTKRAPRSWGGYLTVNNYPMQGGQRGTASIVLLKLGPWNENTTSELEEFFDLKDQLPPEFFTPFWISNISSYWDFGEGMSDDFDPRTKRTYTMGSLIPEKYLKANLSEFISKEFLNDDEIPISCAITRLGGKVSDFEASSSSLHPGWRSAEICMSCYTGIMEGSDRLKTFEEQDRLKPSAAGFAQRLRNFGEGEYLNEADAENPNWKNDFWGRHYSKLLVTKIRYDPNYVFFCHHCVGSTYYPSYLMDSSSSTNISASLSILAIIICTLYL